MHGDATCPSGVDVSANIQAGDTWLSTNLPPLIAYTHTHDALIFLVWDEADGSNTMPLLVIGDRVVAGESDATFNHGSFVKTVEELLGLPLLSTTATVADFGAMFSTGYLTANR